MAIVYMTKQAIRDIPAERDRPVEITPQMVEAGVNEFWAHDMEEVGSSVVVELVFRAMLGAMKNP